MLEQLEIKFRPDPSRFQMLQITQAVTLLMVGARNSSMRNVESFLLLQLPQVSLDSKALKYLLTPQK